MSFITNAAIAHLEQSGHAVFPPGDDQVTQMATHLVADGHVVFPPYEMPLIADYLRKHGYVVYANALQAEQAALKALRARGCRVFMPPSPPTFGSVYKATRGKSPDRLVVPCGETGRVAYRALGVKHVITERGWQCWVTTARARVVQQ